MWKKKDLECHWACSNIPNSKEISPKHFFPLTDVPQCYVANRSSNWRITLGIMSKLHLDNNHMIFSYSNPRKGHNILNWWKETQCCISPPRRNVCLTGWKSMLVGHEASFNVSATFLGTSPCLAETTLWLAAGSLTLDNTYRYTKIKVKKTVVYIMLSCRLIKLTSSEAPKSLDEISESSGSSLATPTMDEIPESSRSSLATTHNVIELTTSTLTIGIS